MRAGLKKGGRKRIRDQCVSSENTKNIERSGCFKEGQSLSYISISSFLEAPSQSRVWESCQLAECPEDSLLYSCIFPHTLFCMSSEPHAGHPVKWDHFSSLPGQCTISPLLSSLPLHSGLNLGHFNPNFLVLGCKQNWQMVRLSAVEDYVGIL
jgi:hypothetical protein